MARKNRGTSCSDFVSDLPEVDFLGVLGVSDVWCLVSGVSGVSGVLLQLGRHYARNAMHARRSPQNIV